MSSNERVPQAAVLEQLNRVVDPCSEALGRSLGLVDMGLIDRVEITDAGSVDVYLRLTSPACYLVTYMQDEAVRLVSRCDGVTSVAVHPDEGLDWSPTLVNPELRKRYEGV